MLSFVLLTIAP